MDIVLEFEFEYETKRTFRFQEVTDRERGYVGTLYVQQEAFPNGAPDTLTVTITVPAPAKATKK